VLTRSNWKFSSGTRVRGSLRDVKLTMVGSMRPATSANFAVERAVSNLMSQSCRTSAFPGTRIPFGIPIGRAGLHKNFGDVRRLERPLASVTCVTNRAAGG
jgi:hypothetical protein